MTSKFLFSVFFVLALHFFGSDGQNRCTTPRGGQGSCVSLPSCPSLYALIQRRPVPPEATDLLRRSQCGFSGRQPMVCCPAQTGNSGGSGSGGSGSGSGLNLLPRKDTCGQSLSDRIYGGENTEKDDYPWMALLGYQKPTGMGFHCGGVLINNRYVLTASHCVNGRDIPRTWRLTTVRLGEWNTGTNPDCDDVGCNLPYVNVPIESSVPHDQYNPNSVDQRNDIALLRLNQNVQFTDYIKPICLPAIDQSVASLDLNSIDMYVAGWGRTETRSASEVLLRLKVPYVDNNSCSARYSGNNIQIGQGQVCAGGEQGKDSCRGDSGGPLMINYSANRQANFFLVGLVSFGPTPCGLQGWPGVYTKVADYGNWITRNLQP